jgi:hypothetical protein
MDHDGPKTAEAAETELKDRLARESGETESHDIVEGQAGGRLEPLRVEEQSGQLAEAAVLIRVESRPEHEARQGRAPNVI